MPFRFRKIFKIAPGVKVNLSKSGLSTSIGKAGATVNIGKKGITTTEGIPGTGISFSQHASAPKIPNSASSSTPDLSQNQGCCLGSLFSFIFKFIALVFSLPFRFISWAFEPERRKITIISIILIIGFCCMCLAGSVLLNELGLLETVTPTSQP